MARCPHAQWKPIAANFVSRKMVQPLRGLVLHITDSKGQTLESLRRDLGNSKQKPPRRSAHFGVAKDGELWQFVDTDDVGFAVDGVWGGNGVDNHWVSVENVAKFPEILTLKQLEALARLFSWLHDTYGVPFDLAEKKDDRGLGYHRMFGIGDHICPGPSVVSQRKEILSLAQSLKPVAG